MPVGPAEAQRLTVIDKRVGWPDARSGANPGTVQPARDRHIVTAALICFGSTRLKPPLSQID
jgi:hypothetical protein